MFDDDAKLAAKELDLTLTSRDRNKPEEEQTPMCGVPYHSVDSYIARLVQKGYKVAICEQMEDPALAKGIVQRDVTRIITPGTVTESCMLEESRNNYIACMYGEETQLGVAFCDVSTGAFYVTLCADGAAAASELGRFSPTEVIRYGKAAYCDVLNDALQHRLHCCLDEGKPEQFQMEPAAALLQRHFGKSLAELGVISLPECVMAAGSLLQLLITHRGKVYSREALLETVWKYDYMGDMRTVDVHIRRLREKIERDNAGPEFIMTKWGVGYYFTDKD